MRPFIASPWFRITFYAVWFLCLLVQASFTELLNDEAYYWVYSKYVNIGYYDHPPMVALFIRAGYMLFKNELGVRLMTVFASMATLLYAEKLLDKKDFPLFATIVSSLLITQVGGFIAVPDSPFLFFIALFLYQIKRYLHMSDITNAIGLGICAAGVLYSKYHGAMFLFFVVLAWLPILKKPTFYITILVAALLYLPHIFWLWQNDFPSFQYHFGDRNYNTYSPLFTLNYFLGQWIIFGPITSFFIFISLFKFHATPPFARMMKWTPVGVLFFLLAFAFLGTVEPNWTICLSIPFIYICHQWLIENERWRKTFYYTAPASIAVLLMLRVFIIIDFTYGKIKLPVEFHGQRKWVNVVNEHAGDLPVVFVNSYQKAAVYSFYGGKQAISLNNLKYRQNEYSLLPIEDSLQGKKVFLVYNWPLSELDSFSVDDKKFYTTVIPSFSSFSKICLNSPLKNITVKRGESFTFKVKVETQFTDHIVFADSATYKSYFSYHFFVEKNFIHSGILPLELTPGLMGQYVTLTITAPSQPGEYDMRISISTGWLPPCINSKVWKVRVE